MIQENINSKTVTWNNTHKKMFGKRFKEVERNGEADPAVFATY